MAQNRIIKQTAPGETTVYINPRWDASTHYEKTTKPITGGSVTEHQHYLYGSHGPVAVHNVIATTTGTGTTTSSHTRYLHRDHLGSVDAITSDTGALVERLSYDAWGKRRQPNGLDAATAPVPATTHHGYTGHEHLDGLGLIHMNARVYDPNIGRFSSADPIGFEGGINLYAYAGGNPLTWLDLAGLSPECIAGCHGIPYQPRPPMSPAQDLGLNIIAIGITLVTPATLVSRFGSLFRAEEIVASSGTTRLWRAVEASELADIKRFGDYNIHENSIFKRFAFDEKSSDNFIQANPGRIYTKTYIDLPTDKLKNMVEHPDPGGVGRSIGIDVYETPEFYNWFDGVSIK